MANTIIEHLDWKECIRRYGGLYTLFYTYPSYWETACYAIGGFSFEKYQVMAELAASIKGRMIISTNDHPVMREVFTGLRLKEVPFRHMLGGQGGKQANELIYFNW